MPYSARSKFVHSERRRAFRPDRVRTIHRGGKEIRLGFKGRRSEVVSVLTPRTKHRADAHPRGKHWVKGHWRDSASAVAGARRRGSNGHAPFWVRGHWSSSTLRGR